MKRLIQENENIMLPKPTHEVISKLDTLLDKINNTEIELKELKFQLRYIPKLISEENLTQKERLEMAKYLYWLDIGIPTEEISFNLLGIDRFKFNKLINDSISDIKCKICGEPILFTSKQKYKEFMVDCRKEYKFCSICPDCKEKEREVWRENVNRAEKESQLRYQEKIKYLKSLPYIEYLQTDHWKELRKKQLYKSNYKCQVCNKSGELNVHHRTYERRGEEAYSDLITLCEDCHNLFHNQGKIVNH